MEASVVDTLVYQLEDDDAHVRYETLQKLRKIAAVERSHFPVRNPRRFLHCLRRRLVDNAPHTALEALRLVSGIMGILGDDVEQILASILSHLTVNLPCEERNSGEEADGDTDGHSYQPVTLHEETYQVFRKYVIVSNDLKAVVELLINMGLAHAHASVREACVLAIMRLLDERYYVHSRNKARSSSKASKNRMDKSLFIALFQALVPILEDPNENVVVAAEEALGKVHLYCGGDVAVVDEITTFLSAEDRRTLRAHQQHIDEFLDACSSNESTSPARMSTSSSTSLKTSNMANSTPRPSSSSGTQKLHFGFMSGEIVAPLTSSITSNSNSDWKRRSVAVEKLFVASKQVDPTALYGCTRDLDALFEILVRLLQDADVRLVKRALQITHVLFYKLSDVQGDGDGSETSQTNWTVAGSYMKKMLPHLVEIGANFAGDEAMEAQIYTVLLHLFQGGYLSVASTSQTLLSSLQHRRLQIREMALEVWILLLLVAQREGFNTSKVLSQSALQALGRLLGDTSLRVKEMALETAAVLVFATQCVNIPELLEANLDEYVMDRVDLDTLRRRLQRPVLPALQENGTLLFQHKTSSTSFTTSMRTSIAIDKSLSGVSELHMVGGASREFGGGGESYLRHSRSHNAKTENLRRSVVTHGDRLTNSVRDDAVSSGTSSSTSGSPCDNWTGTTSSTNAKAGGSLSDRSYLMDQIHPLDEDQSGGNSATNRVDSVAMADKLAMLKKKTSQLRKSASTKQVPAINGYAGENGDGGEQHGVRIRSGMGNQQVVRSPTLNGNNDVEASMPRKLAAPSLATRKRLEAKQRRLEKEAVKEEEIQDNGTPWIQEEASGDAEIDDKFSRPSAFGNKEPRYLEPHEIKPLANPKQDVGKLLSQLRSDGWEMNFNVLNIVRRLAMHHPTFLEDRIHAITKEILVQVPNLRSTVSKNSLLALNSMCSTFQRAMDPEVDTLISVLIKRCTDSNVFVCESAMSSINSVILHCSASKVVNAMAMHLSSKAVPIRREVARSMHTLIVSMADQIQTSKDLTTILGIVGNCLEDSNNEVRDAAKQSILYLCYGQRIDAEKLKKMVPQSAKAKVDQVLSGKAKYTPATTTSAGSKVGGTTATLTSVSSTAQVAKANAAAAATVSPSSSSGVTAATNVVIRKPPAAVITVNTIVLEALQKKLESSNWKDRYDALTDTTSFVCTHAKALSESGKIIGLFDGVTKRMEDGNSKVNVYVLECLEKMIPALGNGMELVLSSFAPALAKNLATNSPKLTTLAHSVIQVLCTHVEAKLLCQHFAVLARHANSRVKPLLIDILDQLASQNDDKNQFALNRYVLPLALELVKEAKSDVKDANVRLLRALYANLGATMLQSVYRQSTAQQEKITSILGISNFAKQ
ncbi:hypothetical protein FI667_g7007, partial [Globisporangium splendens]